MRQPDTAAASTEETDGRSSEHRRDTVTITINEVPTTIHRGRQTVVELKKVGNIALADELEQVIEGKLTPLLDDGNVTIKGGEMFVSHPRDSGSSGPRMYGASRLDA
jgi:hypothetical protein